MPELAQFRLPDVGEGLTEAEIVSWKVRPGDSVRVNDVVVEIETAKSLVELPSPYAGVVADLLVPEGATVDVGTPIISVDVAAVQAPAPPAEGAGLVGGPAPGGRTSVLVGYGPRSTEARRRPRKPLPVSPDTPRPAAPAAAVPDEPAAAVAHSALSSYGSGAERLLSPVGAPDALPGAEVDPAADTVGRGKVAVLAKPPVRKLAKQLGIDLSTVSGTGHGGVVTRGDVEAATRLTAAPPARAASAAPALPDGRPDHGAGIRETRIPVRGVRKATAQAMVASAFTAPHVTEWVTVDVTRTVELADRLRERPELASARVGPLLLVLRALLAAVRRHPGVNASWDEPAQEIVVKHYVNLGIAAATPRGLLVPNVKDAQALSLPELAAAVDALVATAREGRTPSPDLQGGTITVTNVGVFGVDGGTPILNPGEAAILAVGAVRDRPWVVDGAVVARKVVQLALSFDHRLVDGELGSRFLADIAAALEDPDLLLLWS